MTPALLKVGDIMKHYKGGYYQIVGFATHTETLEELILYAPYDLNTKEVWKCKVWARPRHMFYDIVDTIGTKRFTLVDCVE